MTYTIPATHSTALVAIYIVHDVHRQPQWHSQSACRFLPIGSIVSLSMHHTTLCFVALARTCHYLLLLFQNRSAVSEAKSERTRGHSSDNRCACAAERQRGEFELERAESQFRQY
jgi:hypothetical protein